MITKEISHDIRYVDWSKKKSLNTCLEKKQQVKDTSDTHGQVLSLLDDIINIVTDANNKHGIESHTEKTIYKWKTDT